MKIGKVFDNLVGQILAMESFLFSRLFWGLIVVLIGVSIILNAVFKINFPFFRVLFALLIIYFGVKLLVGSFSGPKNISDGDDTVFSKSNISAEDISGGKEFNVVFGSQVVDLSNASWEEEDVDVEINAVFGSSVVILPSDVEVKLKSTAVFGNVQTPDGNSTSFGDSKTKLSPSGMARTDKRMDIEANAVFGNVRIVRN